MPFLQELRRRNVFRAATAYAAGSWLLVQVAGTALPAFGAGDHVLRVLIVVLAIGFVPAVAAAWAFEFTLEGIKRERDVDREGPLVQRTNRLLDRAIVVVLAVALAYFAVDKFVLAPARDEAKVEAALEQGRSQAVVESYGDNSVVVLPFESLSPDPNQAYLGDGMAEAVLDLLAKIPQLRVISRTSAFSFKGKDVGVQDIARRLNVAHVLEGSVRIAGDRLRIAVQLIDARSDTHLWSETYDRRLDDVFAVQDDIAGRVVEQLKIRLLAPAPLARRVDPQAYVLYLQARQMLDDFDQDYGRIYALLRQALQIDPKYADAWAAIARIYIRYRGDDQARESEFLRSMTVAEADRLSEEALDRATALDPDNATVLSERAVRTGFIRHDWAGAAALNERALRLDPGNSNVLRIGAVFANAIGRPEIAVRLGEYAVARDPLCRDCVYKLAFAYRDAGQLDRAEATMRRFAEVEGGGWYTLGTILLLKGQPAAALEAFRKLGPVTDLHVMQGEALALHSLGRRSEAVAKRAEFEARFGAAHPDMVAEIYGWTGDDAQTAAWLERAERVLTMALTPFDWTSPYLKHFFAGPRGREILRRYGVAPEQLAGIRFSVQLPGDAVSKATPGADSAAPHASAGH